MSAQETDILIVGAGIVGLAHAYQAVQLGYKVMVIEKDVVPNGASLQNFGLIWPIGQSPGTAYSMAIKSSQIWKKLALEAGFWLKHSGSIFLARNELEMEVLNEFQESALEYTYKCKTVNLSRINDYIGNIANKDVLGGLVSNTELTLNPREAIPAIINYLRKKHDVRFIFGKTVTRIEMPYIVAGKGLYKCRQVFVCSGNVTSALYPEKLSKDSLRHCRLQMMAGSSASLKMDEFPAIASGLSLIRYPSFRHCASLEALRDYYAEEEPLALELGINLLVSSYGNGEIIIGDSHAYHQTPSFFIDQSINNEILRQLNRIVSIPNLHIKYQWLGSYLQTIGGTMFNKDMEEGVRVVTGLGGSGMTLSFGLALENLREYADSALSV